MANKQHKSSDAPGKALAAAGPQEMSENPRRFEEELADLETIVTQIDSGDLSLEESIGAFERGVTLVRSLNHKLDEVERRVEVLLRGAQGELKRADYQGEGVPNDGGGEETGGGEEDDDLPF
jgi:exodeoxyribonuclease VII small subunit